MVSSSCWVMNSKLNSAQAVFLLRNYCVDYCTCMRFLGSRCWFFRVIKDEEVKGKRVNFKAISTEGYQFWGNKLQLNDGDDYWWW